MNNKQIIRWHAKSFKQPVEIKIDLTLIFSFNWISIQVFANKEGYDVVGDDDDDDDFI